MKINILDCTLRDGGYINKWSFTNEQTKNIITSLDDSGIDVIECGYLDEKKGLQGNSTLFSNLDVIDGLLSDIDCNAQKVVMINRGDYDISQLKPKSETAIDGIRFAFHKEALDDALEDAAKIIDLGYKLYFQPMVTKNYRDIEFLSMIEKVNTLDIYAFYIVDSFGSMTLEEFNNFLILANNNLNPSISVGYHSHNNMQLAFSNAVSMCMTKIKRNIIIDSSIHGVGRGAGNLNTELIADYLNKSFEYEYNTLPLLEVIDMFLSSLMKKSPWGFSPAQFLSASSNCHPNYATYLINKNTNHIVGVRKVLDRLPDEKKSSFDKELIEKLYIESLLEVKSVIQGQWKLLPDKKILLVASGNSIRSHKELIDQRIEDDSYITIGLNHKLPESDCDYYLFSNQKRFDSFHGEISYDKTIITSNIFTEDSPAVVLDFKELVFTGNTFMPNVAIVALNHLIDSGVKAVEVAGLDGYSLNNEQNYSYDETSIILDQGAIAEQNEALKSALQTLKDSIDIEYITPSIFKDAPDLRVIGVIPARYKSTRFEGKPLCDIKGVPMIKRTYNQASQSKLLDKLVVATDSEEIRAYCESEDIPVVLTSEDCLTGTDRIAEVAKTEHYDLYVNIQGDEPVIDSASIDELVAEYIENGDKYIAYNLYKKIDSHTETQSNTIIKVIVNERDELMYMSRLGVPFSKSVDTPVFKKQVCVYGFTRKALDIFSSRNKTINEQFEDIEVLRFLDMGYKVKMKETFVDSIAVDVPEDVQKVEAFLEMNGLT